MSAIKTAELVGAGQGQPTAVTQEQLSREPGGDLLQRLWRAALPIPEVSASHELELSAAAANSGASLTRSPNHNRDDRDRDATSQLASTAHVLASAVHQLGFMQYGQHVSPAHVSSETHAAAFNVRLSNIDADGGIASIDITHAQLGDIGLEVELAHGHVTVIATAATEHSAQVLIAGQAVLAERLAKQGFVLGSLEVVVTGGGHDDRESGPGNRKRTRARAAATKQER